MPSTHHGFILIADITGYTQYLTESELEHAHEILSTLLELILKHTRPPLVVSRTAGDAVISYGLRDNFLQGQTFVEVIENIYAAFRQAIDRMVLNNNCRCNACTNVATLDLKFFVHYGAFALQHIAAHDEMLGSDVNLIHRLLKNTVTQQTGFRAYTLFTAAAIDALGIQEMRSSMLPHTERYEHLGEVQVWLRDMQPVWKEIHARQRVEIPPAQVLMRAQIEIAMPPEQVWDYFIDPEYHVTLLAATRVTVEPSVEGRVAPGSVYHCYHGDKHIPLLVLEWRPFERILFESATPIPNTSCLMEYRFEPIPTGTRLVQTFGKARGPLPLRKLVDFVLSTQQKQGTRDLESFRDRIQADLAARQSSAAPAAVEMDYNINSDKSDKNG